MTQKQIKIIAGMPAYNESKYIGTLVLNTRQYVDKVIIVDDGSTDDTSKIAELAGAEVVKHSQNKGYGAAIQSILNEAKKRDPDVLIILDADAQHDPREIPNMIKPILEGYDVVIGTREKQADKIPLYRRFGQKLILRSVKVLADNKLTDSECGYRAFSRKALAVLNLKEQSMAISAETVAEASRCNLKITEVPVSVTYSKDSSTLNPVAHGLGVFTRVLAMISEQKPLFFFGMAGFIMILIGLVAGFVALRLFSQSGVLSTGWSLMAVFFFILGTISIFNGLTLNAIAKMIRNIVSKYK